MKEMKRKEGREGGSGIKKGKGWGRGVRWKSVGMLQQLFVFEIFRLYLMMYGEVFLVVFQGELEVERGVRG